MTQSKSKTNNNRAGRYNPVERSMVIFKFFVVYDKLGNYEEFFIEHKQSMSENYVNAYGFATERDRRALDTAIKQTPHSVPHWETQVLKKFLKLIKHD